MTFGVSQSISSLKTKLPILYNEIAQKRVIKAGNLIMTFGVSQSVSLLKTKLPILHNEIAQERVIKADKEQEEIQLECSKPERFITKN